MEFLRASFAVVGHPNKGKSSIVSTLARNENVAISRRSGTTTQSHYFKIDTGKAGFELIDTPGFQRPQKALQWLKQKANSADQRQNAIKQFIQSAHCRELFPDEVELLTPIVKGAAILYVVDGSRPYGKEYEIEMEILRWTGRPSMALINPIESDEYVGSWQAALDQYFKTVRIFNPLQASRMQQFELLETFAHLEPKWRQSIYQVIEDLKDQDHELSNKSAHILAELLVDVCSYQYKQKVFTKEQALKLKTISSKAFHLWMFNREKKAFNKLASLYAHQGRNIEIDELELPPDLFDSDKWFAWGLSKKELAAVSFVTGAIGGGTVDALLAGHTFLLGSVIGGAVGFSSAWLGADKVTEFKIKGIPLGGYNATQGPVKNANFPYVIIARFLYMQQQISQKNHANRNTIQLANEVETENLLQQRISRLDKSDAKQLHLSCKRLSAQKNVDSLMIIIRKLLSIKMD